MEEQDKKAVIIGALVAGGALLFWLSKLHIEGAGSSLILRIYDASGNIVPPTGSYDLVEAGDYTLVASVTNLSQRLGQLVAADLEVAAIVTAGTQELANTSTVQTFGPGEILDFSYPFTIPAGLGGQDGDITALVSSPLAEQLAIKQEVIHILSEAIDYGAGIDFGEPGGGGPLPGVITMAAPTGVVEIPVGVGYGWRLAKIVCQLTNNEASQVIRQFRVLYGQGVDPGSGGRIWAFTGTPSAPGGPEWLEVTLAPGASLLVTSPSQFIMPGADPNIYGTYWNPPTMTQTQVGQGYYRFRLQDDLGNLSPQVAL